jgi:hypothetical protein
VKADLDAAGLTSSDYATILGTNPFASGAAMDPIRFLPIPQSFPYSPPFAASDPVPVQKYSLTNAVTYTTSVKTEVAYKVTLGGCVAIPLPDSLKLTLKESVSLDFTSTASSSSTTSSTQSAAVAIGGPAFGYSGPADVLVYWDTVYNSFMFAFPTAAPSLSGVATDKEGKPLANAEVTLALGKQTFRTFSDAKGGYRFYGTPSGQGKISVLGAQ